MTIFTVLIIIYIFVSYLAIHFYFHLQSRLISIKNVPIKTLYIYVLFFLFILVEIPFVFFFPAWLSEKLEVFERTPETTMFLVLFGAIVLAGSIWKGRSSRPSNF